MKIILDDLREFPTEGYYNCFRTYDECILFLSVFKDITYVSLDYNLNSTYTGYDVLIYMHEHGIQPKHINIHSNDDKGSYAMVAYIEENFPLSNITQNQL